MEEGYVICEHRNNDAAIRRFLGRAAGPSVLQVVRRAMRHRVTAAIIVLMNVLGLLAYLFGVAA